MEVTEKNFEDLIPRIEDSIDRCEFLAIDCELSGLKVNDEKENCFESMEERYLSIRHSASSFIIVQFGLCPFFYDSSTKEWTHESFNFYTFPRQLSKSSPNLRFLCESSCLDFLANCGFDFNKLIYEGIPYLTLSAEAKMKEDIDKWLAFKAVDELPLQVPENMKSFIQVTKHKILKFSKNPNMKEMKLENLTPFQRKLIFSNIKPLYSSELYFESIGVGVKDTSTIGTSGKTADSDGDIQNCEMTLLTAQSDEREESNMDITPCGNGIQNPCTPPVTEKTQAVRNSANGNDPANKSRILRIVKLTKEEQEGVVEEKRKREFELITRNIGFSRIIRKMNQSGKFIVGHNMLLDVAHTIHQFVDELPETLPEFKEIVQEAFPNLIDTKYMGSALPFRELINSSVLFDLAKRIQQPPFHLPKIGVNRRISQGYELTDQKKHEAGFDAFITGCCFIGMTQYLGSLQNPPRNLTLPDAPVVLPYLNKLYMMRMSDIFYLNISGTDLTPSRSHVFYVTCPKEATSKHIQQIFSPFGNVQMWWKNSQSLFVALLDKDQSSLVLDNVECKAGFRIYSFAAYQKLMKDEKVKRPYGGSDSPERAGDIFRKLVCGDSNASPTNTTEHKMKRPKTDAEKGRTPKQIFAEPPSWM